MPLSEADLLHLAVTAYESASDQSGWPYFLADFARAIRAEVALLQRHDFSQHRSHAMATFGMRQHFTDSYNQHYSRLNVWRDHGRRSYLTGRVVFDEQLYPRALLKRTEFYNDMLVPNRATHSMAGVVQREGDVALVMTALRDEPRNSFLSEDGEAIERLLPHVARAFVTQERVQALEAGEAALNAFDMGVVLLAADARILFCNRAADDIFRRGDGIARRNDRIKTWSSSVDAALQKLLRSAAAPGNSIDCPPDVLVARPSGRRPYHVTASPLRDRPESFTGMAAPAALVLIKDPERHRPVGIDALKQAYGLTSREAALALTLSEGSTLQSVAEQMGMQYETARTHLRRILSKTGTSRQAELVRLLERMSRQIVDRE